MVVTFVLSTTNIGYNRQPPGWLTARLQPMPISFGGTALGLTEFQKVLPLSRTASAEFTPCLAGISGASVFDLTELRKEVKRHHECIV